MSAHLSSQAAAFLLYRAFERRLGSAAIDDLSLRRRLWPGLTAIGNEEFEDRTDPVLEP